MVPATQTTPLQGPLAEFASKLLDGHPYRAVRRIGAGAMGEVFEVEHQTMGRRLALKSLRQRLSGEAPAADRLRIEAQTAARLRHPNIVDAVDFWITPEGFPCFVMEFLTGSSLADEMKGGRRLPVLSATKYAIQALSALGAAHALGIVHRDIKPENLFLCRAIGRAPWIKVLDFGIARVLPDAATGAPAPLNVPTVTGAMVGTPRYMSPEALEGHRVDLRADLYALGVVLYVMLAGTGPFDRVQSGESLDAPPPPSHWSADDTPDELWGMPAGPEFESARAELDRIVLRSIRERPEHRYQSAAEFAEDLKRFRSGLKQSGPTRGPKAANS